MLYQDQQREDQSHICTQKLFPKYAKAISNVRNIRKHTQIRIQRTQIHIQHCANGRFLRQEAEEDVMPRHEKENSTQTYRGWTKSGKVTAPISMEDSMVKELHVSLDDGDMRELLVQTDPTNEYLTCVKQRIRILDHPKNPLEVLCSMITIDQGLTRNNITTVPNDYCFTRTFLNG